MEARFIEPYMPRSKRGMHKLLGIVFTGGASPHPDFTRQVLAGKEMLIVAADSGLINAQEAGFKPDWIVGDMDSIDDVSRLAGFPPERVLRYDTDKDFTDTELAFALLKEKGCSLIWIIGGGGGRIDHLFGIRSIFEREFFPCRWITDTADIYCIDSMSAVSNRFSGQMEAGSIVSTFPVGLGPWKAQSLGLKWPLDNLSWNRGFFSVSNVVSEMDFSVYAIQGRFIIIIPGQTVSLALGKDDAEEK